MFWVLIHNDLLECGKKNTRMFSSHPNLRSTFVMAYSYNEHTGISSIKTLVVYNLEFFYSKNFII